MTDDGLSLDHVGFMVRDLDAGEARWRKLGFTLAPRSPQMGATPDCAVMAPWATSNHCAMFARGYLELIGITDPARHNPWTAFLDRFEGIHITAFRCADAESAYAGLARRAEGFDPPLQRRRDAPYGDGVREFRFRNIFSQDDRYPEGRFIVIEHQTPEVIWQPALMTHPNGAVAFEEVVFCADPAAPTAPADRSDHRRESQWRNHRTAGPAAVRPYWIPPNIARGSMALRHRFCLVQRRLWWRSTISPNRAPVWPKPGSRR